MKLARVFLKQQQQKMSRPLVSELATLVTEIETTFKQLKEETAKLNALVKEEERLKQQNETAKRLEKELRSFDVITISRLQKWTREFDDLKH